MKIYDYFKNLAEENISQEFKFQNIDETRNYLTEEINQNELMSKKHKKVRAILNYIEHILILGSTVTQCVFISAFSSWLGIPIGTTSSGIGLKICAIIAAVQKHKSIIKETRKKHDQIVLLAKFNKIKINSYFLRP